MNQLKGVVHQKNKEIVTGRIAIGALLVICLVLCAIIATSPNRLMIYSPPTQQAASLRLGGKSPKPNVYAFAYQTFQQLNRWMENGEEEYKANIEKNKAFLTPSCQEFLKKDYYDRLSNGELRERARGVYEIVGRGFKDSSVIVHSPDSWTVNLDLSVDEYFKDEPVKRVLTRFPVNIVRMETDLQNNPWGLGFNCYSSIPLRLEAKEFREGENQ